MTIAAISTGPETHLDHLAPICALLEIPLVVTNEEHLKIGKKCYPMIDLRFIPLADLTLEYIAAHFSTIVTCGKFWAMELKPLIKMFFNKEIRFIFAPHGHSDKEVFLGVSVEQDISLSYGPSKGPHQVEIGNLRLWFYQEYKTHFDQIANGYFNSEKKTVLYAPTWESKATSTSFFESTGTIIDTLNEQYHLLIKLHPLLEENDPARFHQILAKYETTGHFILNFPPIYPLLERTDIYLGDFSSIGYDFLSYNRPMFFLKPDGKLIECGEEFKGCVEGDQKQLAQLREATYRDTFNGDCCLEKVKDLILQRR